MNKLKVIQSASKYLTLTVIFLYPLFFLPIFPNIFDTAKLLLLVVSIVIISLLKIISILINGSVKASISKLDIFVLGFALINLLSGLFSIGNKYEAFLLPGAASFAILGATIYFFVTQLNTSDRKIANLMISLSGCIYSIIQLLSFTGFIKVNFNNI